MCLWYFIAGTCALFWLYGRVASVWKLPLCSVLYMLEPVLLLFSCACLSVPVRDLNFVLDDGLRKAISSAKKRFDEHTGSLRMSTIQYPGMNKAFLKKKKLSADAILQFSLQVCSTIGVLVLCFSLI